MSIELAVLLIIFLLAILFIAKITGKIMHCIIVAVIVILLIFVVSGGAINVLSFI